MTSRKLSILHALLAGAQAVAAASALTDLVGARTAGIVAISVAAVQAVIAGYTDRITTTPADRVPMLRPRVR